MKNIKKIICSLVLGTSLLGIGTTAYADTTNFTLTLTRSGANEDNISKRTIKAGGSSWENRFYVTPTYYSNVGSIYARSFKLYEEGVNSETVILDQRGTYSDKYKSYARPNAYYFLRGSYRSSSNNNSINVQGRYTP